MNEYSIDGGIICSIYTSNGSCIDLLRLRLALRDPVDSLAATLLVVIVTVAVVK